MQSIGALNLLVADYDEAITYYTKQLSFVIKEDTTQLDNRRWVVIAPKNSSGMSLILSKAKKRFRNTINWMPSWWTRATVSLYR